MPDERSNPKNCAACGRPVGYMGYTCRHCSKVYCGEHRIPENHKCPGKYRVAPLPEPGPSLARPVTIHNFAARAGSPSEEYAKSLYTREQAEVQCPYCKQTCKKGILSSHLYTAHTAEFWSDLKVTIDQAFAGKRSQLEAEITKIEADEARGIHCTPGTLDKLKQELQNLQPVAALIFEGQKTFAKAIESFPITNPSPDELTDVINIYERVLEILAELRRLGESPRIPGTPTAWLDETDTKNIILTLKDLRDRLS